MGLSKIKRFFHFRDASTDLTQECNRELEKAIPIGVIDDLLRCAQKVILSNDRPVISYSQLFSVIQMMDSFRSSDLFINEPEACAIINNRWRLLGSSEPLLDWCRDYLGIFTKAETSAGVVDMMYVSSLIALGKIAEASLHLERYLTDPGSANLIASYLPVASLAKNHGINSAVVDGAVRAHSYLERNHDALLEVLAGRSVAVVGNGPSEIGKANGRYIDSHDIVIRFNNYADDGFGEDYGGKTSVWVRSSWNDVKSRDVRGLKCVVWEADYWHYPIFLEHITEINSYADQGVPSCYFDCRLHRESRKASDVRHPTTGLMTLYAISTMLDELKSVSLFGFGFQQRTVPRHAEHYFPDRSIEQSQVVSAVHDFEREAGFMSNLERIFQKSAKVDA